MLFLKKIFERLMILLSVGSVPSKKATLVPSAAVMATPVSLNVSALGSALPTASVGAWKMPIIATVSDSLMERLEDVAPLQAQRLRSRTRGANRKRWLSC